MAVASTQATSQPRVLTFGQGSASGVQLIDNRDRRKGYDRKPYRGYYGHYYGPYYHPYYAPYYGPSVSFSFGF
jgi:hypothetical protein